MLFTRTPHYPCLSKIQFDNSDIKTSVEMYEKKKGEFSRRNPHWDAGDSPGKAAGFFYLIKKFSILGYLFHSLRVILLRVLPKSIVEWIYRHKTDWKKLEREFEQFMAGEEKGIAETSRTPKIIVSLTSYPPRISRIHYTLFTLLRQSLKPDKVVLWLGEEQFPNRNNDLTTELLALLTRGLEIRYTRDIKSYKKLIPALAEFPDDIIVTTDDDVLYDPMMLENLYCSYELNEGYVHAHRGHQVSLHSQRQLKKYSNWKTCAGNSVGDFRNFFTGIGGVLYPPQSLYRDVGNESLFMELSPTADDIWFWAMAVLHGTKICIVENNLHPSPNQPPAYEAIIGMSGLGATNVFGGQNDVQLKRVMEQYPVIEKRLRQAATNNA